MQTRGSRNAGLKSRLNRLSKEQGTIVKDWGGRLPIAIVYPNSYFVGMSNLGFHTVYALLNNHNDIVCERVFLEGDSEPLSVESGRPLTDFAVIAFTVTYELDYFNIVRVLKTSGIPLYSAERGEKYPVITAGGPCITGNPMPLAPFFDFLCIGEAEPILPDLAPVLHEGTRGSRKELLKSLSALPGILVPQADSGKPVQRQWAKDLDGFPVTSSVLTTDTELGEMYLVEAERGCNRGCRFCLVCTIFHPMRVHSVEHIIKSAELGLKYRKRIGLVGPAVTDHPDITEIISGLRGIGAELAISSMRMSRASRSIIGELAKAGVKTITLAPEAGSERLRGVIRKGITQQDILETISTAIQHKMQQLKLYFMIGLPTETDEDVQDIVKLVIEAKEVIDRQKSGTRISVNMAPFVPKAGTPFQRLPMAPVPVLENRIELVKKGLSPKGIRPKYESPQWSEVQAVLARGDTDTARLLAGIKRVTLAGWHEAIKNNSIDSGFYAHEEWDVTQGLPWEVIDMG